MIEQLPICSFCNDSISDKVYVNAGSDYFYHTDHFKCFHCSNFINLDQNLSQATEFIQKKEKNFCVKDFALLFSSECNYCNQPITEKYIQAIEMNYHKDHLFCFKCKEQIQGIFN